MLTAERFSSRSEPTTTPRSRCMRAWGLSESACADGTTEAAAATLVPFYAVNHLGGHLAADVYDHGPLPESIGLLVSGGHTSLLHVRSLGEPIVELGSTVDDAAGEAYDKIARLLGLGYPGGKVLDDLARDGDRDAIAFPRGMTGPRDHPYAFSFSGLKTAVARYVQDHTA